jgi:beta-mannosidase
MVKWFIGVLCSMVGLVHGQSVLSWSFKNPKTSEWNAFGEKGSIQEKLYQSGELPDPFYGKNEELYQWIETYKWEFKSQFYLTEEQFKAKKIAIHFPNVDTYADVYINGKLVGQTDNFFHPFNFEIRSLLQCGYNDVRVVFTPPTLYHQKRYESEAFHFPAPNDPALLKVAPLSRKPQYQFGWDWALRMNTMGFSKPVEIRIEKENEISAFSIQTLTIPKEELFARLKYVLSLKDTSNDFSIQSVLYGELPVKMNPISGHLEAEVIQYNPQLWWPAGISEPNLYQDTLRLFVHGKLVDEKPIQFGIRTAELIQQKDKWGTSYEFQINGVPVFCKGADFIPPSVFPASISEEDWRNQVEQMSKANFNMVRVWGGGFYPDEAFFRACDEKGIMVWQDFMFACAMYPGDDAFLKTVETELNYQIPRISAHPSVVLFNGNNEVDVAWKNWGFQSQYDLSSSEQEIILKAYNDLFKGLAPRIVTSWTNTSYIHTSPLSNWGNDDFYNHGSQHYWGVWHGKDPMSHFASKIGRFNAEYGFQSFPEFATLESFSERSDWNLSSQVMKHHQKSYVGNGMIQKHSDLLYGSTKDFNRFVYYSQLTQRHAVSSAVSGHRLDAPRCMGTLYWQLNDCWPAPTWSSIDYHGNWKALHYAMREDYQPVAILQKTTDKGEVQLYVKSDAMENQVLECKILVYNLNWGERGLSPLSIAGEKTLGYQENKLIWSVIPKNEQLVRVELSNGITRDFLIGPSPKKRAVQIDLAIQNVDKLNKTAEILVKNSAFCADFWLFSQKTGIAFDRNFVHLLPGEHLIRIQYAGDVPQISDFSFLYH